MDDATSPPSPPRSSASCSSIASFVVVVGRASSSSVVRSFHLPPPPHIPSRLSPSSGLALLRPRSLSRSLAAASSQLIRRWRARFCCSKKDWFGAALQDERGGLSCGAAVRAAADPERTPETESEGGWEREGERETEAAKEKERERERDHRRRARSLSVLSFYMTFWTLMLQSVAKEECGVM